MCVGILQFTRALLLKKFAHDSEAHFMHLLTIIVAVVYKFLDLSNYWFFTYKYWTTSLAIKSYVRGIENSYSQDRFEEERKE